MGTEVLNHSSVACPAGDFLWCSDMTTGVGSGQHSVSECFDVVPLAAPYDITQIDYYIHRVEVDATAFSLEVRSWTGSAPGGIVGSMVANPSDFTVGAHSLTVSPPITVTAGSFCIGFYSNGPFQFDRDPIGTAPNKTFLQAPACGAPTLTPLGSLGAFGGNWCMDVTIEN